MAHPGTAACREPAAVCGPKGCPAPSAETPQRRSHDPSVISAAHQSARAPAPGGFALRDAAGSPPPAPAGRRMRRGLVLRVRKAFQSAPPRGGEQDLFVRQRGSVSPFQSAPPRGGGLASACASLVYWTFQSAPPRGGERDWAQTGRQVRVVSIRAPARGRTPALQPSCIAG